jgi:spore germination protein GerM
MRRSSRPPAAALAAATLAAVLVAACGVPTDEQPRAISREQAPDLDEGKDGTSPAVTRPAMLYLTRTDGTTNYLVPVQVQVPVGTSSAAPTPGTALETLLAYVPNDDLRDQGFTSRIPPNTALASTPELDEDGVLVVNLNSNIDNVQAEGSRLAFGQIVCTAMAFDEVKAVRFEVEGQPRAAPKGDGEASTEPVTCTSYDNLSEGSDS